MNKRSTLHEAIIKVLNDNDNMPLSYDKIAEKINKDMLWVRPSDGMPVEAFQIKLRTVVSKSHRHLFNVDVDKGMVKLAKK